MSIDFRPLADRLRPTCLEDVVGQTHLLAEGKPLRMAIERNQLHSMIFWGPPGSGKTTLAKLLAHTSDAQFITLSAVLAGVKDIRNAMQQAKQFQDAYQKQTVLFIDEVHRFNKSQQDAFLPFVEDGTVIFIGATTENPSFELNNALLSRARTYVLKSLEEEHIVKLINRAIQTVTAEGNALTLQPEALSILVHAADGDARKALTFLQIAIDLATEKSDIDAQAMQILVGETFRRFDKGGEAFYDQISALHKSVRGSDPDAALYWFVRMIDGGCDPLYVARRVVRMASEDIGNADPRALSIALNAWDVQERLGSPEGELAIAQAVIYMACAAKSNAVYTAFNQARKDVKQTGTREVPLHLRNAPTQLMKELNYGKLYRYAHDEPDAYAAGEHYFPDDLEARHYYQPVSRGLETKIAEKLAYLRSLDQKVHQQ